MHDDVGLSYKISKEFSINVYSLGEFLGTGNVYSDVGWWDGLGRGSQKIQYHVCRKMYLICIFLALLGS